MSLGLAIFLSALIISLVLLFNFTKDRWNWKRILKTIGISIIIIVAALEIWFFVVPFSDLNNLEIVTNFWDINLGSSMDDVRFFKGIPTSIDSINSRWMYDKPGYESWEQIVVSFNKKKVSSIVYFYSKWGSNAPKLSDRVFNGYNLQSVKDIFGEPTDVSSSIDGLRRVYLFKKYQVIFVLKENKVFGYGMYNPRYPTLHY